MVLFVLTNQAWKFSEPLSKYILLQPCFANVKNLFRSAKYTAPQQEFWN